MLVALALLDMRARLPECPFVTARVHVKNIASIRLLGHFGLLPYSSPGFARRYLDFHHNPVVSVLLCCKSTMQELAAEVQRPCPACRITPQSQTTADGIRSTHPQSPRSGRAGAHSGIGEMSASATTPNAGQ